MFTYSFNTFLKIGMSRTAEGFGMQIKINTYLKLLIATIDTDVPKNFYY